jgi:hypothetical protein
MVTPQQLAAAQTFLTACDPANTLQRRLPTQNQRTWQAQLQAAQATRRDARAAMQDLCGTREGYQAAIAAAREIRTRG